MADGEIRINTKLDNKNFIQGSRQLADAIKSFQSSAAKMGKDLASSANGYGTAMLKSIKATQSANEAMRDLRNQADLLYSKMNKFSQQKFATKEFRNAENEIQRAEKSLERMREKQKRMQAEGKDQSPAWKSINEQIEKATEEADKYDMELQRLKKHMRQITSPEARAEAAKSDKAFEAHSKEVEETSKAYAAAKQKEIEIEKRLDSLYTKQEKLESKGEDRGSQPYVALLDSIKEAEAELDSLKAKRDSIAGVEGKGFVFGKDTDEYGKMQEAYNTFQQKLADIKSDTEEAFKPPYMQAWESMTTLTGMISEGFGRIQNAASGALHAIQNPSEAIDRALGTIVSRTGQAIASFARMAGSAAVSFLKRLAGEAKNAAIQLAKLAANAVSSGLKKIGSAAGNAVKGLLGMNRAQRSANNGLKVGLKNILKYAFGIRSMFFLFRRLRAAISEGFGELKKQNPEVKAALDSLSKSFNGLKGSLAAAFAPILTAVAPMLTTLINMLTRAINTIGAFFAALTGKSTVAQSIGAIGSSAGKSSGKVKELKRELAGFDELNILKDKDNGGGGGGGGSGSGFSYRQVPIDSSITSFVDKIKKLWDDAEYEEVGKAIAGWVNRTFEKAKELVSWENVKGVVTEAIDAIAGVFNGFVTGVHWWLIGATVGAAFNTIIQSANRILTEVDWTAIGDAIGNFFIGLEDQVSPDALGDLFVNAFNAALARLRGFLASGFVSKTGTYLGRALTRIFTNKTLFTNAGKTFNTLASEALSFGSNFLAEFRKNLPTIVDNIKAALGEIDWAGIANEAWELFKEALLLVADFISALFSDGDVEVKPNIKRQRQNERLGQYTDTGTGTPAKPNTSASALAGALSDTIVNGINGITKLIEAVDWTSLGKTVAEFIFGIDWATIAITLFNAFESILLGIKDLVSGVDDVISQKIFGKDYKEDKRWQAVHFIKNAEYQSQKNEAYLKDNPAIDAVQQALMKEAEGKWAQVIQDLFAGNVIQGITFEDLLGGTSGSATFEIPPTVLIEAGKALGINGNEIVQMLIDNGFKSDKVYTDAVEYAKLLKGENLDPYSRIEDFAQMGIPVELLADVLQDAGYDVKRAVTAVEESTTAQEDNTKATKENTENTEPPRFDKEPKAPDEKQEEAPIITWLKDSWEESKAATEAAEAAKTLDSVTLNDALDALALDSVTLNDALKALNEEEAGDFELFQQLSENAGDAVDRALQLVEGGLAPTEAADAMNLTADELSELIDIIKKNPEIAQRSLSAGQNKGYNEYGANPNMPEQYEGTTALGKAIDGAFHSLGEILGFSARAEEDSYSVEKRQNKDTRKLTKEIKKNTNKRRAVDIDFEGTKLDALMDGESTAVVTVGFVPKGETESEDDSGSGLLGWLQDLFAPGVDTAARVELIKQGWENIQNFLGIDENTPFSAFIELVQENWTTIRDFLGIPEGSPLDVLIQALLDNWPGILSALGLPEDATIGMVVKAAIEALDNLLDVLGVPEDSTIRTILKLLTGNDSDTQSSLSLLSSSPIVQALVSLLTGGNLKQYGSVAAWIIGTLMGGTVSKDIFLGKGGAFGTAGNIGSWLLKFFMGGVVTKGIFLGKGGIFGEAGNIADWLLDYFMGGAVSKGVGLSKTGDLEENKTVGGWIINKLMGDTPKKEIDITRGSSWGGYKTIFGWIANTLMGSSDPVKSIGITQGESWEGYSTIYGWIANTLMGKSNPVKSIGITQGKSWEGATSIYGWITDNLMGKSNPVKPIGVTQSDSWKGATSIYGWITDNFMGKNNPTKPIGIKKSDGWAGKTIFNWINDNYMGTNNPTKPIALTQDGWTTVSSWISGFTGSAIDFAVNLITGNIPQWLRDLCRVIGINLAKGGIINSTGKYYGFAKGGALRGSVASMFGGIRNYAGGTTRAHGTLFRAGEAGPEVVGHVGGRTEVLNKSQMAQAIYSAVVAGMTGAVNALGKYIANHMTTCTNAIVTTISANSIASGVNYYTPAMANGSIMPYEVSAQIARSTQALQNTLDANNDQLIQAIASAVSNATLTLVNAIQRANRGTPNQITTQRIIDEINRQSQMYNRSPLKGV